jgi:hypothetical protein
LLRNNIFLTGIFLFTEITDRYVLIAPIMIEDDFNNSAQIRMSVWSKHWLINFILGLPIEEVAQQSLIQNLTPGND